MSGKDELSHGRREFLKAAGIVSASVPAFIGASSSCTSPANAELPSQIPSRPLSQIQQSGVAAGYQLLGIEEAAFTEALVDHMWPADELSPAGSELGIAIFIDRQLAGAFGQGDRLYLQGPFRRGKPQQGYQLPMTPAEYYNAGLSAAANACQSCFGRGFDKLSREEREQFLQDLASGKLAERSFDLAAWFNGLVYPLFERGAFADPIYGGNRGKAAWSMIGYPGLPTSYGQDVVRYRGKPHPRSQNPRSIQDFS